MKFKLLSTNTMLLVGEVLKNQKLLKLIDSNDINPIATADIVNKGALVMKKIIPAPYTGDVLQTQQTNLRIFFSDGRLENRVILDSRVVFQIILHRDLWNIVIEERGEMKKKLRPYEIMHEIVECFEDKTIKSLGILHFKRYNYQHIDKDYAMYTIEAVMTTI